VEYSGFVGTFLLGQGEERVLVGEYRSVLSDDVEQMDPTRFNRLGDVVVSCKRESMSSEIQLCEMVLILR